MLYYSHTENKTLAKYICMYFVYPQETNLRATQYLPDIVRLQQCLYDSFHHRLDQKEARRMTIGDFLQSRKHGEISTNSIQAMH